MLARFLALFVATLLAGCSGLLETGIGFDEELERHQFVPGIPEPVGPDHPLFRNVEVAPIEKMPERITYYLSHIADREEYRRGLESALREANLLSPDRPSARFILRMSLENLRIPFQIGWTQDSSARFRYILTPIYSVGPRLGLDRTYVVGVSASTGNANRAKTVSARVALLNSIRSATWCLANYENGRFPGDCSQRIQKRE